MKKITIDEHIHLELIEAQHTQSIFDMVDGNRTHLRQWLPFVDRMQTVDFTHNFVAGTIQRNKDGYEFAYVIFNGDRMVGRIGVYKMDRQNGIGEIGYWLVEDAQGQGIVTKSCRGLIDFCFGELGLNRIEIKCGTANLKSKTIPEQLHFTREGTMRQGELLYDQYIDLDLYAMLKKDWK